MAGQRWLIHAKGGHPWECCWPGEKVFQDRLFSRIQGQDFGCTFPRFWNLLLLCQCEMKSCEIYTVWYSKCITYRIIVWQGWKILKHFFYWLQSLLRSSSKVQISHSSFSILCMENRAWPFGIKDKCKQGRMYSFCGNHWCCREPVLHLWSLNTVWDLSARERMWIADGDVLSKFFGKQFNPWVCTSSDEGSIPQQQGLCASQHCSGSGFTGDII